MSALIADGSWTPSSKTAYVVTSNDPYSLNIAKSFQTSVEKMGWEVVGFDQFTVPQANWGGELVKIRDENPGVIVFSDYAAGDEASFMKQFARHPTKSLVYQQYAPSIPQYLQLAGSAANGVIWSTVVGILQDDPVAQPFIDKFTAKFGSGPGFSNAGDQYDLMKIWAQAAGVAGDPVGLRQGQRLHQGDALPRRVRLVQLQPQRSLVHRVPGRHRRPVDRHGPPDVPDPGLASRSPSRRPPTRPGSSSFPPGCNEPTGGTHLGAVLAARGSRSCTAVCAPSMICRSAWPAARCSASPGPTARERPRCSTRSPATRSRLPARSSLPAADAGTKIHARCRLGLARTFQQPVAADTLTVLENAYLAASFRRGRTGGAPRAPTSPPARRRSSWSASAPRDDAASLLPVYDKKRLMIATALATDPLVLLLDEPFGGLNPREIDATVGLLRRVRETGVAIVCIEHVMRALVAIADRVLVMHHGAELFIGTPAEMMRDQRVIDVYLGSQRGRRRRDRVALRHAGWPPDTTAPWSCATSTCRSRPGRPRS